MTSIENTPDQVPISQEEFNTEVEQMKERTTKLEQALFFHGTDERFLDEDEYTQMEEPIHE